MATASIRHRAAVKTSGKHARVGNNAARQVASSRRVRAVHVSSSAQDKPIIVALAADSGCGKSTFMRRMTGVFGGEAKPPEGGNPDSNTLLSDMTTVICLDDYHSLDRYGRKKTHKEEERGGEGACVDNVSQWHECVSVCMRGAREGKGRKRKVVQTRDGMQMEWTVKDE